MCSNSPTTASESSIIEGPIHCSKGFQSINFFLLSLSILSGVGGFAVFFSSPPKPFTVPAVRRFAQSQPQMSFYCDFFYAKILSAKQCEANIVTRFGRSPELEACLLLCLADFGMGASPLIISHVKSMWQISGATSLD